jgi:hypothetical protein
MTNVFIITMSQDMFNFNLELEKYTNALNYVLSHSYSKICPNLYLKKYKIYFTCLSSEDLAAVANVKAKARANFQKVFLGINSLLYVNHSKPMTLCKFYRFKIEF